MQGIHEKLQKMTIKTKEPEIEIKMESHKEPEIEQEMEIKMEYHKEMKMEHQQERKIEMEPHQEFGMSM